MTQSKTPDRTCEFCSGPIPTTRQKSARFCHGNCGRKASYYRRSPEERAEINRKSNLRRYQRDLLPHIRTFSHVPPELEPGSPIARWVVMSLIAARLDNWKLDLALNYATPQKELARLAGGEDVLIEIEEHVFELAAASLSEPQTHPQHDAKRQKELS